MVLREVFTTCPERGKHRTRVNKAVLNVKKSAEVIVAER